MPFRLSVVIPVYNGARTIGPLVERLRSELGATYALEIVLVDDGSADDSRAVCRALAEQHPAVVFVGLARNFGEHNAVMAGLRSASGDAVVTMDDDFQNPPQEVSRLVEKLRSGFDVVFSRYERKQHSPFRNAGSWFNNAVATAMLDKPYDLYLSSFKAMNRFLVDEITAYRGPFPYIDGLVLRTTCHWATETVAHDARAVGRSNYTLRRLVRLWLAMFTNFSVLPLRVASMTGFLCAAVGIVLSIAFGIERLEHPDLPIGWASVIVTVLVVSGVQLVALGTIGEYLGRLFLSSNGTPQFVVRERAGPATREGS
jgi:undecaprenyl-phosphate 4-deoxy-4-formamido-L-arabinose transferase